MSPVQLASGVNHASASNLFGQAAAAQEATSGGKVAAQGADVSAQFSANATNVTISREAKAVMERAEADKAAAEQLSEAVKANKPSRTADFSFDEIFDIAAAFSKEEDSARGVSSDAPTAKEHAALLKELTQEAMVLAVKRKNPEAVASLREAFSNDTVQVHKASNVPGVELNTIVNITDSEGGRSVSIKKNPTHSSQIQAEIDSGRAYATHLRGVGDVYLTW